MNRRTIIKLIALFISLVILVTLIEILLKKINVEEKENKVTISNKPIITAEEKKEEDVFNDVVDEVLNLFNKREYEKIYERLDNTYKEAKYPSFDEFKKAMDEIISDDTNIEISEIIKHPVGYFAMLSLDGGEKHISLTIKNISLGFDDSSIMLDSIYDVEQVNLPTTWGNGFSFTIKYIINYLSEKGYVIEVWNDSNKDVHFFAGTSSYIYRGSDNNEKKYYLTEVISDDISAHKTKSLEFKFNAPYGELFLLDTMKLWYSVGEDLYCTDINLIATESGS